METLKTYFNAFSADVKEHAVGIIVTGIIINLFFKFGIGLLFGVALVGFIAHALYTRFAK